MPIQTTPINSAELHKAFRIKDGMLERYWRQAKWEAVKTTPDANGYYVAKWKGKLYKYHRIIWVLNNNNDIPAGMDIDHIDGNPANNSLDNLRVVTRRENSSNKDKHRDGKLVGCYFNKHAKKWMSRIRINGKNKYLGYFKTEQEAHNVYVSAFNNLKKEEKWLIHIVP
jgi:hypothetical protein